MKKIILISFCLLGILGHSQNTLYQQDFNALAAGNLDSRGGLKEFLFSAPVIAGVPVIPAVGKEKYLIASDPVKAGILEIQAATSTADISGRFVQTTSSADLTLGGDSLLTTEFDLFTGAGSLNEGVLQKVELLNNTIGLTLTDSRLFGVYFDVDTKIVTLYDGLNEVSNLSSSSDLKLSNATWVTIKTVINQTTKKLTLTIASLSFTKTIDLKNADAIKDPIGKIKLLLKMDPLVTVTKTGSGASTSTTSTVFRPTSAPSGYKGKFDNIRITESSASALSTSSNERVSNTISVYPNPANKVVTISSSEANPVQGYTLIDATGKQIKAGAINNGDNQINIEGLNTGVYILSLKNSTGENTTRKIIKK